MYNMGMGLNSIARLLFYVNDLDKTATFYEALGFREGKKEAGQLTYYVNWFSVVFVSAPQETKAEFKKEAALEPRGAGMFTYVKVDDVDEYYKEIVAKGLKPSSEPRDWPWGNREFVMRDPDGYKLVFFNKSK